MATGGSAVGTVASVIGKPTVLGKIGVSYSLTVSVETGATVTATNGSKTVTGTSSNNSCTLMLPAAGTWTVSATKSGSTSNTKTVTVTDTRSVELTIPAPTSILNDNSWETIYLVSNSDQGANYWAVGDRKAVKLNGTVGALTFSNETYYAFIIGFNHNATYEGAHRIHFQFAKTALTGGTDIAFIDSSYGSAGSTAAFRMNTTNTNVGGWASSYMRTDVCGYNMFRLNGLAVLDGYSGTFCSALPYELRAVIKDVTKYTDNTGNNSAAAENVTATTDFVFLLSEYEVFGSTRYANPNESSKQAQYAYYSAGNSKVKYRHSATGSTAYWWLRSPRSDVATYFTTVSINGVASLSYGGASYSNGFAPGFCV